MSTLSYAHLFTPESQAAQDADIKSKFSKGEGVVALNQSMSDSELLLILKYALENCRGKPFLVVSESI